MNLNNCNYLIQEIIKEDTNTKCIKAFNEKGTYLIKEFMICDNNLLINHEKIILQKLDNDLYVDEYLSDTRYYLVLRYIDGIQLDKCVFSNVKDKLNIFLKICYEVKKIHNRNIIHCDLKPNNILINNNEVFIIDYGSAIFNSAKSLGTYTVGYASPEQLNKKELSFKTDIYSLGIILFQLITDKEIFKIVGYYNYKNANFTLKIKDYNFDVPDSVENIFIKCTQKDEIKRYDNIEDLIKDITFILKYYDE